MPLNKPLLFLKLGIATICAILALALPLYILSTDQAVILVKYYSYWMLGATCLLALYFLYQALKAITWPELTAKAKAHLPALLLILLASLYLHLHVERGFKILFDEHTISSTAMSMYDDHRAFVPAASHIINRDVVASIGFVDKRPAFFPFIVSLVHSLSGYRPENVFWLNSGLTFLLLSLVYTIAAQTCGKPHGRLAVLLLTSLPLLAENTQGGGYEIMNLCLICGLVLAGINYMRQPGSTGLNLLLLASILLANNRYESIVYVVVPALLCLLKGYREKKLSLSWFAPFSPLLLIVPLLSYAVFQGEDRFIQTSNDNFFSAQHLSSNLAHALTYLFETTGDYSNSVLLSAAGIIACLFLAVQLIRRAPFFLKKDLGLTVPFVVFLVVAFNTTLALSCYWGAWTDPMTSRFSLPLQLCLALSVPLVLHYDFKLKHIPKWMPITCLLSIVAVSSPHASRMNNEPRMSTSVGNHWALNWVHAHSSDSENLYLAESAIGLLLYRQAALPFMVANEMPERVIRLRDWKIYDNIYVLEVLHHHASGAESAPKRNTPLNPRFVLETVAQKSVNIHRFYRISRVVALNPAQPGNQTKPSNLPPPQIEGQSFSEQFYDSLPLIPWQDSSKE